ncbi:MAG TPA: protein kinase [Gemmataceae bacterium]|nr:protein kinase [Gemmataceae bacterium]
MPDNPNNLDVDWRPRIAHGSDEATVRDLGVSVREILLALSRGTPAKQVLTDHPGLQGTDLRACLAYAAEVLKTAKPPPDPAALATQTYAPPAPTDPREAETIAPPAVRPDRRPTIAPATPAAASSGPIQIPGYEILEELGRGGMGVVFKARNLQLDRVVALKMILAAEYADADLLARFRREAQAAAQLPHASIVQVYEVGEHDGRPYIVQEYIPGGSLASWTDQRPWSPHQAAALVEALAHAVQAAHDHGIIHRDLKPDNVLMTEDGQPKIADFGLAKRLDVGDGKTRTGAILGTPEYMAPEQAGGRSKEIGKAADVYALGAILYRLMTGRPPFRAPDMFSLLTQVLEREPQPMRTFNRKMPHDLETITLTCLAKDPKARYASAAALAADLRRFVSGEPIQARRLSNAERFMRFAKKRPGAALARGYAVFQLLVFGAVFAMCGGLFLPGQPASFSAALALPAAILAAAAAVRVRPRIWAIAAVAWAVPALFTIVAVANGMSVFGWKADIPPLRGTSGPELMLWSLSGPVGWLLLSGLTAVLVLGLATATPFTKSRLASGLIVAGILGFLGVAYLANRPKAATHTPENGYPANSQPARDQAASSSSRPGTVSANPKARAVLAATSAGLLAAPIGRGPLLAAGVLLANKPDPPAPVYLPPPSSPANPNQPSAAADPMTALFNMTLPLLAVCMGAGFGGLIRLVRRYCGGDLLDVAAGALIGGAVFCGIGSIPGAIVGAMVSKREKQRAPR